MKFLNSKTILRTCLLCFGVLAVSAGYLALTSQSPLESELKSFPPDTQISYAIISTKDHAQDHKGDIIIDETGHASLPILNLGQYQNANIAYNLDIKSGDQDLNVLLKYDHTSKSFDLSSEGLPAFHPVHYDIGGKELSGKTDWAGFFRAEDVLTLSQTSTKQDTLTLAFNGLNLQEDTPDNPSIIKIQLLTPQSTGGIGNIPAGVNEFSPTGQPKLSSFATDRTRAQVDGIIENFVRPMQDAATQLTAVGFQYMQIIGSFIDAKNQMETQRNFQRLQAEAHRDYHPSEQMCVFGTFVRSMNNAQGQSEFNASAINQIMMSRYTLQENTSAAAGPAKDIKSRARLFIEDYCNPSDQNNALETLCETNNDQERFGRDIDYPVVVLEPLTIDVNFADNAASTTADQQEAEDETERDIISLAKNLYWFNSYSPSPTKEIQERFGQYLNSRQVIAMHSVAHNSFSQIVGMKAKGTDTGQGQNSGVFMKEFMEILLGDATPAQNGNPATTPVDPDQLLGENPSYYAMMEVLTKKLYQDGNFFTNLYDKPANVSRIKAALQGIELMQNRDRYESQLRQEMLTSLLLENAILPEHERVEGEARKLQGEGL